MKRLFLIALALVVLLVAPVCAWNQLSEFDVAAFQANGYEISGVYSGGPGVGAFSNITRIWWNSTAGGICRDGSKTYSTDNPGSYTADMCESGNKYGTAEITWDVAGCYSAGWVNVDLTWDSEPPAAPTFYKVGTSCTELSVTNEWRMLGKNNYVSAPEGLYQLIFPGVAGHYITYSGSNVTAPVASFTCTPTSQFPDTDVVCTDTSINAPTDWYWSIDAEALGIKGWKTNTTQNFTWQSAYPGLYSVNLRANNSAGYDWENKTNYVSISDNATPNNCNIPVVPGLIRSWAQCVDSQTSGAVSGCDLSLYDLEGGAWSNVTDRFDGTWCIDTYPGHHFNAYGSAEGYTPDPTYRLNLPVSSSVVYELLMHPGYVPPAVEGKVWVYGIVNDADTGAAIEGAVFRLDASGQTPKSDTTDAAGSMHIQWVNKTQTTATASKPGYGTISKVFTTSDFGPDTVRIEIHRSIVTPTPTATTGPGGTVPTTVNPNGPNNGVYPSDYTNTQGQAIMNLLAYHGYDLVLLCIFVTMLALLGFKLGK